MITTVTRRNSRIATNASRPTDAIKVVRRVLRHMIVLTIRATVLQGTIQGSAPTPAARTLAKRCETCAVITGSVVILYERAMVGETGADGFAAPFRGTPQALSS
jgi:hypothetical protein